MIIEFTPDHDMFGSNSVKSFVNNLDCYQSCEQYLHGSTCKEFVFTNTPSNQTVLIVDVFELFKKSKIKFSQKNIIVTETLRQLVDLIESNCFDLTKKYIVFSESWWDENLYQWPGFDYTLVYVSWEINDIKMRLSNQSDLYCNLYDIDVSERYSPQYDFLCLAGRGKRWRDLFIAKLRTQVDLSNSLSSYFGESIGHSDLIHLDVSYSREKSKFENEFYSPQGNSKHPYVLSYFTKFDLFAKTKFSIVVETEAEHHEYHVTEKTLKCLVAGHPFVVIGTPRYLEFLRNLGFMTCQHLFSESYDTVVNLDQRMDAVINLVKHLQTNGNFDKKDLIDMQSYNLRNLFRLKDTGAYKKFLQLFDDRHYI